MSMKKMAFAALILTALLLLSSCAGKEMMKYEEMPGGRRDRTREDAPKTVESKDIERFECEFTYGKRDREGYTYCSFKLERMEEGASCRMTGYDDLHIVFDLDFQLPRQALEELQKVVEEYDLARYNGRDRFTSGLPEMLGTSLLVVYKSGERIYAYDNASSVLDYRAEIAIHDFFRDLAKENGLSLSAADQD